MIIVIEFTNFSDSMFEKACEDNPTLYPGKFSLMNDCEGYIHNIAVAVMTIIFLVYAPLRFALARILKYAWLEQVRYHERKSQNY